VSITLLVAEPGWRSVRGLPGRLRRAAGIAVERSGRATRGDLTLLLADDARLHALNLAFRAKDRPTNVLSFPARSADYLGDVAMAYGMTRKEAREQGKTISDHATHLAVHGVLHLLGYDHETARAARIMEPLEVAILSELGIGDPYARKAA
jgi:probable rRNA maturation factor